MEPGIPNVRIDGWKGKAAMLGLGKPEARGCLCAVAIGVAAYLAAQPSVCFTAEGRVRPFKALSSEPDATYAHFLLLPLGVGLAVTLFSP